MLFLRLRCAHRRGRALAVRRGDVVERGALHLAWDSVWRGPSDDCDWGLPGGHAGGEVTATAERVCRAGSAFRHEFLRGPEALPERITPHSGYEDAPLTELHRAGQFREKTT